MLFFFIGGATFVSRCWLDSEVHLDKLEHEEIIEQVFHPTQLNMGNASGA